MIQIQITIHNTPFCWNLDMLIYQDCSEWMLCYYISLIIQHANAIFSEPSKSKLGLREAGVHLAPCNSLSGIINATGDVWGEGDSSWVAHLWGQYLIPPTFCFLNLAVFLKIIMPTLPQEYCGHQNNDLSNVSPFFYVFCQGCEVW